MNPKVGWALAVAALAVGGGLYGLRGLALAASVVVFWLVLQFNRTLRVMRDAAAAPMGRVPSAVMLHAKLRPGLTLLEIVRLTKSLGRALPGAPDTWAWADEGGAEVVAVLERGRLAHWRLVRTGDDPRADDPSAGAPPTDRPAGAAP